MCSFYSTIKVVEYNQLAELYGDFRKACEERIRNVEMGAAEGYAEV